MKRCKECEFYVQHYGICKDLKIHKVECGHCMQDKKKYQNDCPFFVVKTDKFEKNYYYLANFYNKINKEINELQTELNKIIVSLDIRN